MRVAKGVLAMLVFVLLVGVVYAGDMCCEKLSKTNDYCVYADESECDSKFKKAFVECEETSYCKLGCCYSSDDGRCFKQTSEASCIENGGSWSQDEFCEIDQCKKGCCIIGMDSFYATEVRCKQQTSNYDNVSMNFVSDVENEWACLDMARSQEEGCCVSADQCSFTTRVNCGSATSGVRSGNDTQDGFYPDMLCSNDLLSCGCAKQASTGCVAERDEVYWFDSCGNRENVYDFNKIASYNDGFVQDPDQSCTISGPFDSDCGNCNYNEGTLCSEVDSKKDSVKMKNGGSTCRSVSCSKVGNKGVEPTTRGAKKNGESWCVYDSSVGHATDPVGARHFRHLCVNGIEMTEPCQDFREEICVQGVLGNDPENTFPSFGVAGDYVEASCRDNRWEDCWSCNNLDSCGGDCDDYGSDLEGLINTRQCCAQKCCNEMYARDCYWLDTDDEIELEIGTKDGKVTSVSGQGFCVPEVPPGLKFWPEGALGAIESSTRSSPATTAAVGDADSISTSGDAGAGSNPGGPSSPTNSICAQANQECTVSWFIGGIDRIFGGDYECTENCHCTEKEWVIGGNTLCKALGDCGAYFNILGKSTMDGYSNTASGENNRFNGYDLKESDIGDWKTLRGPDTALEDKLNEDGLSSGEVASGLFGSFFGSFSNFGGLGSFFSRAKVPLAIIGLQGVTSYFWGSGDFGGATSGVDWVGSMFGSSKSKKNLMETFDGFSIDPETKLSKKEMKDYGLLDDKTGEVTEKDFTKNSDGTYTYNGKDTFVKDKGANIQGAVNTAMWLYTLYIAIDVLFEKTKTVTYEMSCSPWVAPTGGDDCEKCNEDKQRPCSNYRCKSLGQTCALINEGSDEERCVNLHPNDANSPIISPWPEAITHAYSEGTSEGFKGFSIKGQLGAYESVGLGLVTDEPSQCKFDTRHSKEFDDMAYSFGSSLYDYEHDMTFTVPEELTTKEAFRVYAGGIYTIYIKCKDGSGNANERDYFIKFKFKRAPDLTPPVIERTSIENGVHTPKGGSTTPFSIFVSEKASCKWDISDGSISMLSNSFSCSGSSYSSRSVYHGLYECKTTLTDTNPGADKERNYYIKCVDPSGNENSDSYVFTLRGSDSLNISSSGPKGDILDTGITLTATTVGGSDDDSAVCGFAAYDAPFESMIEFIETGGISHSQILEFTEKGDYTYYIRCRDSAGNEAVSTVNFAITVDLSPPELEFIYLDGNSLHIELSDESNCEHSDKSFSFGGGTALTGVGSKIHELSVQEDVYYITCVDLFDNEARFVVYPFVE